MWCPVRILKFYIARTRQLRGDATQLFITTVYPHHPASVTTIARWIVEAILPLQATPLAPAELHTLHSTAQANNQPSQMRVRPAQPTLPVPAEQRALHLATQAHNQPSQVKAASSKAELSPVQQASQAPAEPRKLHLATQAHNQPSQMRAASLQAESPPVLQAPLRAHQTRSMSTSWALFQGVPITDWLEEPIWPSTFTSCYLRDVLQAEGRMGRQALQTSARSAANRSRNRAEPFS